MYNFLLRFCFRGFRLRFFGLMLLFCGVGLVSVSALETAVLPPEPNGNGAPDFSKVFTPNTIGSGSVSTLVFTIDNITPDPVSDIAFTDNMPAGVLLATPANVVSTCIGTVTAVDGSSVVSFSDGQLASSNTCTITVDVTSSVVGTHTNTSSSITSNAGTGGTAIDDLTVDPNLPGFSKSFSPSTIDLGGRSTLTFTFDNSANSGNVTNLSFTDDFPIGLEVANPANASTDCLGAIFTAVSGAETVSFTGGFLTSGQTCTAIVDVVTTGTGALNNSTSELTHSSGSSGKANAILNVSANSLYLQKEFVEDPIAAGDTVDLIFTIENQSRSDSATGISFTDDLDATLSGLVATALPQNNVCGSGSTLSGTGLLTLSGGTLAPEASCSFTVTLQVPGSAATGAYPNTTTNVMATVGGDTIIGSAGNDTLFVAPVPILTKTFIDDPVAAGDDVTLEFQITNSSPTQTATGIAFEDELTTFLPFPVSVTFSPDPPCGAGSSVSIISLGTDRQGIGLTNGSLDPSASCTFTATITLPVGLGSGSYLNTTTGIRATIDSADVEGAPATDTLEVVSAPRLTMSFTDDPVLAGELVTLEFTIEHGEEEPGDATNIAFTDDVEAVLSGLVAVDLPKNDVCGAGSQLSGTSLLSLTNGTLSPGDVCTFTAQLQMPSGDILPGMLTNTTSDLTAVVSGLAVTGFPATDDLLIGGLNFSKQFADDPTIPGDTVTLEYTIENESDTYDATGMFFTDNLTSVISGMQAVAPLPTNPCGAGSTLTGTTFLILAGGNLAPETSCTFSVTVQVPVATANDSYTSISSNLTASINASSVSIEAAVDNLVVDNNLISLTKEYVDNPALSGETTTLRFTLENLHQVDIASSIVFTDDLAASLTGLVAVPPLPADPCGTGSQINGTTELLFTNGQLGASATCTFDVTVQVPDDLPLGAQYENVTSDLTAMIDGFNVIGYGASDTLVIGVPSVNFPFAASQTLTGADLVVSSLTVSSSAVTIVVTNEGDRDVTDAFWIDLYLDPSTAPTAVNQTWQTFSVNGAVWGVDGAALPLEAGESITLTLNDSYFYAQHSNLPATIAVGTAVYVQVDSANTVTTYGAVLEDHEVTGGTYNNIFGPVSVTN